MDILSSSASVILSVLIVTYKSRDEIRACLGSIPRQVLGRPVEVIVVENASDDGIGKLVQEEFPWVVYLEPGQNLGFGKANNLAYELACGEFVLFLNPDTISNDAAYRHCIERLQSEPRIGIISPKLVMLDGEMDLACRRSIPTVWDGFCRALGLAAMFPKSRWFAGYNLTYLPDNGTYDVGSVNGAFMMCPRRALQRVGVFDEQFFMYGDDLDLNFRFKQAGYRVVYDGRTQIIHIKGASSSKEADKMAKAVFHATKQFYLKHFNPHGSWLVTLKYAALFGAWEALASLKASLKGYRRARPL
jgi:N-acetylglucosaminyl-diphospho-decaprenol L-rhamnosyltransferase